MVILLSALLFHDPITAQRPEEFVDIRSIDSSIVVELKYYSSNNFIGKKINGYNANKCFITKDAALALKHVQADLAHFGYGIKIFDGYRPQRSVDHFVKWARNTDRKMKKIHYPVVQKRNLFKEGYIASKSGHSRGSTIDLTIIDKKTGIELDMGTIYDFFGKESWIDYDGVTDLQKQNRLLLQSVMKKFGFKPLKEEWWHFTLYNETFPDTYFNFLIE